MSKDRKSDKTSENPGRTLYLALRSLDNPEDMMIRLTWEGAWKWAFRDLRRELETSEQGQKIVTGGIHVSLCRDQNESGSIQFLAEGSRCKINCKSRFDKSIGFP
jgi:hypothetical protein